MNYLKVLYNVLAKVVPLYMAMILAYGSVKWWKLFTPDQCSGINKFVSLFVVPFFSFHFISINNPYTMNFHFILADSLQKLLILLILFVSSRISSRVSLECSITVFSLSTLPNTLAVGIPLLQGMYGDFSVSLMVQIVMLQCLVWYTLLLILFEFRAAKIMISHKFPDSADLISAVDVHSDVISLDEKDECLETEIQVREDGKLHVRLWKSSSSSYPVYPAHKTLWTRFGEGRMAVTHNHKGGILWKSASVKSDYFSKNYSNFGDCSNDAIDRNVSGVGTFRSKSLNMVQCGRGGGGSDGGYRSRDKIFSPVMGPTLARMREEEDEEKINPKGDNYYEINGLNHAQKPCGEKQEIEGPKLLKFFSRSRKVQPEIAIQCEPEPNIDPKPDPEPEPEPKPKPESVPKPTSLPPARVMTKLILTMVRRKLIRNPNTYSSFIGLAWSLISFKWNVTMPAIVANSVKIMSDTGLGMAMFSLGLFMASQPRIIAGGKAMAAYGAAVKFIVGPAVTAATAVAVGLRGNLLRITIVQASLPLGILPFVYAKEYDVHPDILSTAVIFGLLIALPITLVYFILLGLIK